MVRIPRRTHSVSGPPSVHAVLKDVACCCNMVKIRDFYLSMMALRRNPQRKCKKEEMPIAPVPTNHIHAQTSERDVSIETEKDTARNEVPTKVPRMIQPKAILQLQEEPELSLSMEPFPFFDLPREVRDHVYSYLVVRRGRPLPIIESKAILKSQKKRATAQRTRERLNQKRISTGKRPIKPRETTAEPIIHLNVLQASKLLHYEASDYMYQMNWFAISLDNFPSMIPDVPQGWNFSRITRLQLELQLKDAQRMNSHIDWATFFASFSSLRFLRIIPTFHPRYYEWASAELSQWQTAHFIHRAFFRELLAVIPGQINLKLGHSGKSEEDMRLEGKAPVKRRILWEMYVELGMRRDINGNWIDVRKVVDCDEVVQNE